MERDVRRKLIARIEKQEIDLIKAIALLKYEMSLEDAEYVIRKLSFERRKNILANPFPSIIEDIASGVNKRKELSTISQEFNWILRSLGFLSDELGKFLELEELIINSILKLEVDSCWDAITTLESDVCISLHSVNAGMLMNELTNNSSENKDWIAEVANEVDKRVIILLEFFRIRIRESSVVFDSILEHHKKLYNENDQSSIEYVDFKLNPLNLEEKYENLFFIVNLESNLSIIDRYLFAKEIIPMLIDSENEELTNSIKESCIYLTNQFAERDLFWEKVVSFLGNEEVSNGDERSEFYSEIESLLFSGHFDIATDLITKRLKDHPAHSELYIFFVQLSIVNRFKIDGIIPKNWLLFNILECIRDVLLKGDNYTERLDDLSKHFYSLRQFGFSYALIEILQNEQMVSMSRRTRLMCVLNSHPIRYNFYAAISENVLTSQIAQKSNLFDEDFLTTTLSKDEIEVVNFFKFKVVVGYQIHQNKIELALSNLNMILDRSEDWPEFIKTWLIRNIVKCFYYQEKFEKAIDLIVDDYFKKGRAFNHYLDKEVANYLIENGDTENFKYISVPLYYHIYNRQRSHIYDAMANFLIECSVEKPSDLLVKKETFQKHKFIYFLRNVCTREILEDSPFLNSPEELDTERLEIIDFLKADDSENDDEYNEEILTITKEANIRKGLLQLHESRIYIDTEGIKRKIRKNGTETFQRYIGINEIVSSDVSSRSLSESDEGLDIEYFSIPVLDESMSKVSRTLVDNADLIKSPLIRFAYFSSIFELVKRAFIYDGDYGFKSFLSMRIRHGTFPNAIRSVFDQHHLVAVKGADGEYKTIEYWKDIGLNGDDLELLDRGLKRLSARIDEVIQTGMSWLTIRESQGTNVSAFDFDNLVGEFGVLSLYHYQFGSIKNYEELVDGIFKVLNLRLERSLLEVRERFDIYLAKALVDELNDLIIEINRFKKDTRPHKRLEDSIVTCRTDIQRVVEQLKSMMHVSKTQHIQEFGVELIVETSINYIHNIYKNSFLNKAIKQSVECPHKFKGKHFESIGDILINLLDNAISNNRELGQQLKVDIGVKVVEEKLQIGVKNNLPKETDITELKTIIEETKNKIESYKKSPNKRNVSFEQGSGFLKISKSLAVDLARDDYTIEPRLMKNSFFVLIEFPLLDLIIE